MSELPNSWAPCTLEECCTVISGQSPPGETYNEGGIGLPFCQGRAEFNELPTPRKWCTEPTKTATTGDVLISVRAPVGPTNLANEPCCIGRGLAALRPFQGVEARFVLYKMRATEQQLAVVATGSTFSAVSSHQRAHPASAMVPVVGLHFTFKRNNHKFPRTSYAHSLAWEHCLELFRVNKLLRQAKA